MATTEKIILDPVIPDLSPSLYWTQDSWTGGTDLSGNGRNATLDGGVTPGDTASAPPGWNNSTTFDGVNDDMSQAYTPFVVSSTRTFTGWAYRRVSTAEHSIFSGANNDRPLFHLATGSQNVLWYPSVTGGAALTWAAAWPANAVWVHWALVAIAGTSASLYINGALVSTQASAVNYNASPGLLQVGCDTLGLRRYDGRMARFEIYEYGLSASDISTLYQRGVDGSRCRIPLDITPWIGQEGIDWGDAEITTFMADKERGSVPVDYTVPNRDITGPLVFSNTLGGTTTTTARANIQAKLSLFQREGGQIQRVTNSGGTLYADVVDAALQIGSQAGWETGQNVDVTADFKLTCLPDFYQKETLLSDHTETVTPQLSFTETSVAGDYPARCRIVVDEDQAQDQRGLIWAFRSRFYDSSSQGGLSFGAETLTTLDTAAKAALTGATGGTVVTHGTLSTNWTPVLGTNLGGTFLTHQGTYRLYARIYSTSGTTVQTRAVWDVGDLVNPAENDSWRLPGASNFYMHDYGEVRLDASPVGVHRWQGQIQAKGDVGGENFSVDSVWLVPVDEGYGVLTSPMPSTPSGFTPNYSARDEFNQTSGTLTGKVLPVGGTWTAGSATGTGADFSTTGASNFNVTRTAVSEGANGRFAVAGVATFTNVVAQADMQWSALTLASPVQQVLIRYTDTSNYVSGAIYNQAGGRLTCLVRTVVASSITDFSASMTAPNIASWMTVRILALSSGQFFLWVFPQGGSPGNPVVVGQSSVLATGGTLATGKVGLADWHTLATAVTRTYDNFQVWVPTPDAVNFASRSVQLTTDGQYRLDSGGTAPGPVAIQTGDLPRLPVAGLEGRTTEVFLKLSRGDFDQLPDAGIDDLSARISYRPCYLTVPNT